MAVLVTKSTTTNVTDTNGYYESYGYNVYPNTAVAFNYTINSEMPNFTANSNVTSIIVPIQVQIRQTTFDDIQLTLLRSDGTVTFDAANNLVNKTSHGYSDGDTVQFSSTGSLPIQNWGRSNTGYVYYVSVNDANSFYIYRNYDDAIAGGATGRQTFNSAGSGTHTCWFGEGRKRYTSAELNPNSWDIEAKDIYTVDFVFDSPVAVTTTDTYRLNLIYADGGPSIVYLYGLYSSGNYLSYIAVSDVQASYSNSNDFICATTPLTVDVTDFTPKAYNGEGSTIDISMWLCNANARTFGNDVMLKWEGGITTARTTEFNYWSGSFNGIQIGESTDEITAQYPITASILNYGAGSSIYMYGETPANQYVTLTGDVYGYSSASVSAASPSVITCAKGGLSEGDPFTFASNGATLPSPFQFGKIYYVRNKSGNTFNLSETPTGTLINTTATHTGSLWSGMVIKRSELSSDPDFEVDERIYLDGGSNPKSSVDTSTFQYISDKTSDAYGFGLYRNTDHATAGVGVGSLGFSYIKPTGTRVYSENIYGIRFKRGYTEPTYLPTRGWTPHLKINGVMIYRSTTNLAPGSIVHTPVDSHSSRHEISNIGAFVAWWFVSGYIPPKNTLIQDSFNIGSFSFYNMSGIANSLYKSGTLIIRDCYLVGSNGLFNYQPLAASNLHTFDVDGLDINGLTYNIGFSGTNSVFKNVSIKNSSGGVYLFTCYNLYCENISVDNTVSGLYIYQGTTVLESRFKNLSLGATTANTSDFSFGAYPIVDLTIEGLNSDPNINTTNLETITGTIKLVDYNSTVTNDKVILPYGFFQRVGGSLPDTTLHTAGADKYAIRFESTANEFLRFIQNVPTQDIKDKTMVAYVWVKLNSANYWAGSHEMPRLTINYDNGTLDYAEATQTTDWQIITMNVTPTTSFGSIDVRLSTKTAATGSDSYVYFDDVGILYPAGHQLDLGGLDSWAGALPVTPTIATNVSAADVWNVPTSTLTGTGTIGRFITKLLTVAKFLGLK